MPSLYLPISHPAPQYSQHGIMAFLPRTHDLDAALLYIEARFGQAQLSGFKADATIDYLCMVLEHESYKASKIVGWDEVGTVPDTIFSWSAT